VLLSEFDFDLPAELIAQEPAPTRSASRLLVLDRASGEIRHSSIEALPDELASGDLVVVNDTRVFAARLFGVREPSGGAVECLLLRHLGGDLWQALVHPGQKLKPGSHVRFGTTRPILRAEILERHTFGRRTIRLWREDGGDVDEAIDALGQIPLPPYIKRPAEQSDRERYQTVFAQTRGSVAAPTAGLHFTPEILERLIVRGIERTSITLHVGYGTFEPIRTEIIEEHRIHAEPFAIPASTSRAIETARAAGRRIVAVGTTTTRTLEHVARLHGGRVPATAGEADLYITPGFEFQVVGALLTNFHLPRSSLLVLVSAFAGRELVLRAYREAIRERYRFYSYGDAMLIT
jgi:S-adenosylmethionine:tRNA ribosyltransferase-isomerase